MTIFIITLPLADTVGLKKQAIYLIYRIKGLTVGQPINNDRGKFA